MNTEIERLLRPNIARLQPYSSARSEYQGDAEIYLDANENAYGSPTGEGLNRYPDPLQKELKIRIAALKNVDEGQIFIGNGSDEAIDVLFRIFCEPGRDQCIICPPTYGMYGVSAAINDVEVLRVPLTDAFQLEVNGILSAATERTKLIFVCSPNNPTGNLMIRDDVIDLAKRFSGLTVVDEAYIDFAAEASLTNALAGVPRLVVLQTFSKAWGMAGVRVGMAFAHRDIVEQMNRVKPPYNVGSLPQRVILEALDKEDRVSRWIEETRSERERLRSLLSTLPLIREVLPSDANFLLVKVDDAKTIYGHLKEMKIIVRDRSEVPMCEGCLRITVGTPGENDILVNAMRSLSQSGRNEAILPILLGIS